VVISDNIFSNAVSQRRRFVVNWGLARNETPQKTEVKPSSFLGVLFGINRLMGRGNRSTITMCSLAGLSAIIASYRFLVTRTGEFSTSINRESVAPPQT
jgi:hypothetical protein